MNILRKFLGFMLIIIAVLIVMIGLVGLSSSVDTFEKRLGQGFIVVGLLFGIAGYKLKKLPSFKKSISRNTCQVSTNQDQTINSSVSPLLPAELPTAKQIRYAKRLGILITPNISKKELSNLIDEMISKNPRLQRQQDHIKENILVRKYGEDTVAKQKEWVKFAETTEYMLAVYELHNEIIVDVLFVSDACIDQKGNVQLFVSAPKLTKDHYLGRMLEWEQNFKLEVGKLLYHEPLHKDIGFCDDDNGVNEYCELVQHGLKVAKKLKKAL